MNKSNRRILLVIGPLLMILCTVLLPAAIFETLESRAAIGTVVWMAFWWITGPVDYAVTAFLPIAVNAVLQMVDMKSITANYASETILLLLGASILTASTSSPSATDRFPHSSATLCFFPSQIISVVTGL